MSADHPLESETATIRRTREQEGRVVRLTLCRPKANLVDAEMIVALQQEIDQIDPSGPLVLVVLDHEGPSFSYGASVEEHMPDKVAAMLGSFHRLLRSLEGLGVPTAAVVHGQCLGGGFELALATGRIFVEPRARLGLPEIGLGVFPPAGSVLLPLRVSAPVAAQLVLSGSILDGVRAVELGVAEVSAPDPRHACEMWFAETLASASAVAVRQAWRAVRRPYARALEVDLGAVERQYLADLMTHRDPVEGLTAFLEKRTPRWSHS